MTHPALTPELVVALDGLLWRVTTYPRLGTTREEDALVAAWKAAKQ